MTSPTPLPEQAEEREANDVNGTGLIPVCGIGSIQTWHLKPEKVLGKKQNNTLSEDIKSFMDEDMSSAAPPNAPILR